MSLARGAWRILASHPKGVCYTLMLAHNGVAVPIKIALLTLRVDTYAYGAKPLNLRDSRAIVLPPAQAHA
jgi:hypothetical protein